MPIEILPENQPDWMQFDTTEDILFMGEDAFWQTKAGAANPDQAILFRGGLGFFDRSTDGGKTWASVLGPASQYPPWFTAGDITWTDYTYHHPDSSIPRPTKYQITYRSYASNPTYTGEHAVLASYVVTDGVDTNWDLAPMWILYTFDDWSTSKWQQLVNEGISGLTGSPSFGQDNKISIDDDMSSPNGWQPHSELKMVGVLSVDKVVLVRIAAEVDDWYIEACVADIVGNVITEGSWYTLDTSYNNINNPKQSSMIEMDDNTILFVWAQYPDASPWTIKAVAATITGGTVINPGTQVAPSTPYTSTNMRDVSVCRLSDTKAVVAAVKNNGAGTAWIVTVSGNSATFGAPYTFSSIGYRGTVEALAEDKFVVMYSDSGDCYAKIGDVSGTTISFGSAYQISLDLANTASDFACTTLTDSLVIFGFEEQNVTPGNRYKRLRAGTVSGTVITLGTAVNIGTTSLSYYLIWNSLEKLDDDSFLYRYLISGDDDNEELAIGKVSGTTITMYGPWDSENPYNDAGQIRYLGNGTAIVYSSDETSLHTMNAVIVSGLLSDIYKIESLGSPQVISSVKEHGYLVGWYYTNNPKNIAVLSETKVVLMSVWQQDGAPYATRMQVWVANISGDTITEGARYAIGDTEYNTARAARIQEMDSNTFLSVRFEWFDPDHFCQIQAGSVSGTTVTMGNQLIFSGDESDWGSSVSICRMTDSIAIVGYVYPWAYPHDSHLYLASVTVSGNTTSWLSSKYAAVDNCYNSAYLVRLTDTKFVILYRDNVTDEYSGKAVIGDISGSTLSFGSEYDFMLVPPDAVDEGSIAGCRLTDTTFVVSFYDAGALQVRIGTVSGQTISWGPSKAAFTPTGSWGWDVAIDRIDDGHFMLSYISENSPDSAHTDHFNIGTVSGTNISFDTEISPSAIDDSKASNMRVLSPDMGIFWRIEDDCINYDDCEGSAYIVNLVSGIVVAEGGDISERYYAGAMNFTTNGEHLWIPGLSRDQSDDTFKLVADWLQRNPGSTWDTISYANWGESGKYPRYYGWEVYGDGLSRAQAIGGDFFVHLAPWPYNSTGLIAYGNMRDHADLYLVATHYNMVFNDAWADRDSDVSVSHVIWVKTATGEEVRAAHYYSGRIYALLNTSTGAELWESSLPPYAGGSNFTHKDDAILDEVGDNAMDVDERDGTIVIANKVGDLLIIASTPPPYTFWYNFTLSHRNDRGVTGLIVL